MCATPEHIKTAVREFLKETPSAATMTFDEFWKAVSEKTPTERAAFAVTVTLMELLGEITIIKDEMGRGRGFALPEETPATL